MHNSTNNSMMLDQAPEELERENKKLRKELGDWTKNYQQLEGMYIQLQKSKGTEQGRSSLGASKREPLGFSDSGSNIQAEKAKYEATIKGLLAEVEQLKVHPNYSYKISVLVKDLEQRIGRLFDASIQGVNGGQSGPRSVSPISTNVTKPAPVEYRRTAAAHENTRGLDDSLQTTKSDASRHSRANRSIGQGQTGSMGSSIGEEKDPLDKRELKTRAGYKEPVGKDREVRESKGPREIKEARKNQVGVSANLNMTGGISAGLTVNTGAPYYFVEDREENVRPREMAPDRGPNSSRLVKNSIGSRGVSSNQMSPRGTKTNKLRNQDKV